MTLTKKSRRELIKQAHHLEPSFIIGKEGLKDGTFKIARETIKARELIKIRFNDHKEEKQQIVDELCEALRASHVRTIGHIAILYKPSERD